MVALLSSGRKKSRKKLWCIMLRHYYTLSSFHEFVKVSAPHNTCQVLIQSFSFTGHIRQGEIPLRAGRAASTNGEGSTLY